MIKKGIPQPCFYADVINKTKPFKSDTSKLVGSLKNLIRKGYDLATIVHFLRQVYFVRNIENNLLVQLVCSTSNYIKTFIFHSIFDIILSSIFDSKRLNDIFILASYEFLWMFNWYRSSRGHDRMVVGFTATCAISTYHH